MHSAYMVLGPGWGEAGYRRFGSITRYYIPKTPQIDRSSALGGRYGAVLPLGYSSLPPQTAATLPTPTLRRLLPRHARQLPRLLAFIAVWHRPKTLALHLKDERDRGLIL